MSQSAQTEKRSRYVAIDMARGLAILGVVFYHLLWDLRYFEFILTNFRATPALVWFQASLLAAFLGLSGVSLVLAHENGIRWNSFWRRIGILVAASVGVSAITYFTLPDAFVYFGVLHAIALFSIMALPFLWLPVWVVLVVAGLVFFIPALVTSSEFNSFALSWVGFYTVPPYTLDLVPIFPCFSYTLIGLGLTRLALRFGARERLAGFTPNDVVSRALAWAGRKSLPIYLLHQLALMAVLYPLALLVQPAAPSRENAFLGSCTFTCSQAVDGPANCHAYCQCALEQVAADDLWDVVNAPTTTPEQLEVAGQVSRLCTALTSENSTTPLELVPKTEDTQ